MQLLLVNTGVVIVVTSHLFLTPAVVVAPLLVYVGTQRLLLVNASAVVVVTNRLFLCGQMLLVNAMLCLETRALGEGDDRLITRLWNKLSAPCSRLWGLFLGNWRVGGYRRVSSSYPCFCAENLVSKHRDLGSRIGTRICNCQRPTLQY